MASCPICSNPSAGKRIAFKGFEVFDLCIQCASYSICLISPNVEVKVKENAIRWADIAIENNREKMYLANCIRSWKQSAEDFIAMYAPAPVVEKKPEKVFDIDSTEINLDATIKGFNTGNYSAVMNQENKSTIDSSVLDVRKESFFTQKQEPALIAEPAPVPAEEITPIAVAEPEPAEKIAPVAEAAPAAVEEETPIAEVSESVESETDEIAPVDTEETAEKETEESEAEPSLVELLREISKTLRSIDERMERIETELRK